MQYAADTLRTLISGAQDKHATMYVGESTLFNQ